MATPFSNFALDDLSPGSLADTFAAGNVAAIIECGPVLERLWSALMHNPDETLPWELPLLDLARNHRSGSDIASTLGDVFYFQPGQHSYVARKLEIERTGEGSAEVQPQSFRQGDGEFRPQAELIDESCALVDKIMLAITPLGKAVPEYRVAVQRLKYQAHWPDYEALAGLVADSLGRWGRWGYAFDVRRQQATTPFSRRGLSEIFGLLMSSRGAGKIVGRINDMLLRHDPLRRLDAGLEVYEHAHTDHRFFSALCGSRQNVRTEVLFAEKWLELPVTLTALAVFPGKMSVPESSRSPTIHRVLYVPDQLAAESGPSTACERSSNVTALLGAS